MFLLSRELKNIISSAHKMGARWQNNELGRQVTRRKATVACKTRIYFLVKTQTMFGFCPVQYHRSDKTKLEPLLKKINFRKTLLEKNPK
jgi:hypothetical protein